MKSVFKIAATRRPAVVAAALLAAALLAPPPPPPRRGTWNNADLLADFFKNSEQVTFQQFDLAASPVLRQQINARLGYVPSRDQYTIYVARTAGHVDGYAIFDNELGQHLPITYAVKLSPAGLVERQ